MKTDAPNAARPEVIADTGRSILTSLHGFQGRESLNLNRHHNLVVSLHPQGSSEPWGHVHDALCSAVGAEVI